MEDASLTFTLSGTSSVLEAHIFPPIELSEQSNYALGLVELSTFNSIPNVDSRNNKFRVKDIEITSPTRSYELLDIEKYLQKSLKGNHIGPNSQ